MHKITLCVIKWHSSRAHSPNVESLFLSLQLLHASYSPTSNLEFGFMFVRHLELVYIYTHQYSHLETLCTHELVYERQCASLYSSAEN